MRALLDINILLALLDGAHIHHHRARVWFESQVGDGWASCPFTQNGFVRIISQPNYPKHISTAEAIELISAAVSTQYHEFWSASISILQENYLDRSRVHGPKQLTDLYLLSLAVSKDGSFVTFDKTIPLSAVPGAGKEHLIVL